MEVQVGREVITVHSFTTTPPSGSFPYGRLTQGSDGFLYGTTAEGGAENLGAIYRLDPATGAVTSIHSFITTHGVQRCFIVENRSYGH